MENLWSEFRSAPTSYFQSARTNPEALVAEMTQVLASEQEKREQVKLMILGIWQEMCHILFKDSDRLTNSIKFLKDLLTQQKVLSHQLFASQVLCTITTLLIEMETALERELAEFICILFEHVEKMKSESNRLLKSIACDCLRELEMTYPGLLASKVGHFYGMSVAENSHIHQHYKALFAVVLDHALKKFLYEKEHEGFSPPPDTLAELLSYGDPLKTFKVSPKYKEVAVAILRKKVPASNASDVAQFGEVKKAVTFILDWSHLFTPSCLIATSLKLVSCVQSASFSPKMLKRLFQHSPSHDIRLFQLMLLLKLKFGAEICDEEDNANLRKRLMTLCGQPTLPDHHRALVWEWLIQWPLDSPAVPVEQEEETLADVNHTLHKYEQELREKILRPSPFDSHELFFCKCKALCAYQNSGQSISHSFGPSSVSVMVTNLLKLVRSGATGAPVVILYRVLYHQYMSHPPPRDKETERLLLDLVLKHPKLVPNTIDFTSAVQQAYPESPLPVNIMSQVTQFLSSAPLDQLLSHFQLYLVFIKHAVSHRQINPVVLLQLLTRVLSETSLCSQGAWDIGNVLIEICTTIMRVHPTDSVFKDLSGLLQQIAEKYDDLDIQDRARFYYQLMLTVSADKLSAILMLASDSTTGTSLSDIVEARISNTLFPSASPVRKVSDGSDFISLERVPSSGSDAWKGYRRDFSPQKVSEDCEGVLESYLHSLEFPMDASSGRGLIHIHYRISFIKKPQGISNTVYAVVLTLSKSPHYHPSPDVYIPFLSLDVGNGTHINESKVVSFTIQPKEPVPTKFEVSAVFSTEEGVTYSTTLSPVSLGFTDLFLPVSSKLQEKIPASELFSLLWNQIESIQQPNVMSEDSLGVLSIVHLDHNHEVNWETLASELLRSFEVLCTLQAVEAGKDEREEAEDEELHNLLIFLPPHYHLLLKFQMKPTSSNVAIATDNWRLLPLVNTYLQSLVS